LISAQKHKSQSSSGEQTAQVHVLSLDLGPESVRMRQPERSIDPEHDSQTRVVLLHRMARTESAHFPLLELPDSCLVAVLQCCAAADQRSVFSAARTHSRLHQAAVAALHSISALVPHQQQLDQVLLYLGKHGSLVGSIQLESKPSWRAALCKLPANLRLSSLQLEGLCLQLQHSYSFQGVLGDTVVVAALKQLRLRSCQLYDVGDDLEAALPLLPSGLEHLSINGLYSWYVREHPVRVPAVVLQPLQQLTYLELSCGIKQGPDKATPALQPLTALTRLVDLRLHVGYTDGGDGSSVITAAMLSHTCHLTRLQLSHEAKVEPGILACKTKLQHLQLVECVLLGREGEAQLLSHLQHLQQLTYLSLCETLRSGDSKPSAYAALTASSMLERLDIGWCRLPDGVWPHIFPTGRQLPHLRWLGLEVAETQVNWPAEAPDGSSLVSCCPSLWGLNIEGLQCTRELLVALQGLSRLCDLYVDDFSTTGEGVEALCQLKQLEQLYVACVNTTQEGLLLQLTQLKQLGRLTYIGRFNDINRDFTLEGGVSARLPTLDVFSAFCGTLIALPACLLCVRAFSPTGCHAQVFLFPISLLVWRMEALLSAGLTAHSHSC
jgi:hypothetical protein